MVAHLNRAAARISERLVPPGPKARLHAHRKLSLHALPDSKRSLDPIRGMIIAALGGRHSVAKAALSSFLNLLWPSQEVVAGCLDFWILKLKQHGPGNHTGWIRTTLDGPGNDHNAETNLAVTSVSGKPVARGRHARFVAC
jgi:hypothetical protein